MFSRMCVCWGGVCWNRSVYLGVEREVLASSLSFAATSAGSGPWWPQAWCPQSRRAQCLQFCPCFEPALHPPGSLSWSLQHFLSIFLAQIHKVVCMCLPHWDKSRVFFPWKVNYIPFYLPADAYYQKSSSSREHKWKAVVGQWTPFFLALRYRVGTSTYQHPFGVGAVGSKCACSYQILNEKQMALTAQGGCAVNDIILNQHVKEWHWGWVDKTQSSSPHCSCFQ